MDGQEAQQEGTQLFDEEYAYLRQRALYPCSAMMVRTESRSLSA